MLTRVLFAVAKLLLNFWFPTHAHMVEHTATKLCMVIKLDERRVCIGSTTPWDQNVLWHECWLSIYLR